MCFFWLGGFDETYCVGIAPVLTSTSATSPSGSWDSIHVFEASERGRNAHYKLTSTIMLHLVTKTASKGDADPAAASEGKSGAGEIVLSGSMTRQVRFVYPAEYFG